MIGKKKEKVTLESLDSRIKVLGTQVEDFELRFKRIDTRFDEVDKRFDKIDRRMDTFEESQRKMGVLMETMDGKLSLMLEGYVGHDARIARLEQKLEG